MTIKNPFSVRSLLSVLLLSTAMSAAACATDDADESDAADAVKEAAASKGIFQYTTKYYQSDSFTGTVQGTLFHGCSASQPRLTGVKTPYARMVLTFCPSTGERIVTCFDHGAPVPYTECPGGTPDE
jgi:uncharacterized membrane protein